MKHLDLLGYRVRDVVTGFTGVAESIAYDLYGCIQVTVKPAMNKDGKTDDDLLPSGRWFDAQRLKKVGTKRVMEPPCFEFEKGPADLPRRKP